MTTPATLDPQAARTLTDRIKVAVEGTWLLIQEAYTSRAWSALGYDNWDAYCTAEFGASRLRLPREERQEVVASLRESGLSIRAIAAATGSGYGTVRSDLENAGEQNRSPVVGSDGKTYPPPRPAPVEHPASHWVEPATEDPSDEQVPAMPRTRPSDTAAPLTIGPAVANRAGRLVPQRSQRDALASAIATLNGLCTGLNAIDDVDTGLNAEEVTRWTRDLSKAASTIRRLNTKLKEQYPC